NVRLLGWIDKDQVSALLSRSDIGLLPYVRNAPQGLPNKVFEYMAYGVFQIATLAGEAKSLLEATGTGVSIPSATAGTLSDVIKRAVGQDVGHDQRIRRQSVFEERFEAGHIYGGLIDHIEKVVESCSNRTTRGR
ncbi:MAG TPA: glycosyltransferase, partial [Pseudorhizobium sp.]|nr:glycosyltransferase [Pseudorhizobium sp.]